MKLAEEKFERSDLRSQVTNSLKTKIISGILEGEIIYSSSDIALSLGVSITPVREAILDLARSGLVEVVRNRGFRVISMSDKALDEVAEVRKNLEPLAMKLIVERAQESEIKALLPLIGEMKETVENDIPAFLVHEHKFTVSLLKLSDNQRLIKIISELIDQTRLKIVETKIKIKPLSLVIENHEAILAALLERDAERASALRLKHVEDIRGFWR